MGLAFREWAAFIAKETNAAPPPLPPTPPPLVFSLFLSNIVDQKEVVLRVTLEKRSKCSLHVSPSNGCKMRKRESCICRAFHSVFEHNSTNSGSYVLLAEWLCNIYYLLSVWKWFKEAAFLFFSPNLRDKNQQFVVTVKTLLHICGKHNLEMLCFCCCVMSSCSQRVKATLVWINISN